MTIAANQIHFYDAATPENVPSGVYAAAYVNGFAWPAAQIERMARVMRISVRAGEPQWARHARCLDCETGAANAAIDLVPFVKARRQFGFDDATGYVNRSNWLTAILACQHAGIPEPLWWVATLDGTQQVERPAGAPPGNGLWAVQYATVNNAYDLSILHGVNNFVRP